MFFAAWDLPKRPEADEAETVAGLIAKMRRLFTSYNLSRGRQTEQSEQK
jgi:hypothetical protein